VGPNYARPPAPVARDWIDAKDDRLDATDVRVRRQPDDLSQWWTVFNDPVLDALILRAAGENLTVREAGFRVLEARAQRAIARGNLLPQTQEAVASYSRNKVSESVANQWEMVQKWFSLSDAGFNLAWELDFWGRFIRAVEAADAELNASVENYDDVLVTLLADVATAYVQIRTLERRIELAKKNIDIQKTSLKFAEARFNAGTTYEGPVDQAKSDLAATEALIPSLEIAMRVAQNQLCILLGMPPYNLREEKEFKLRAGVIPAAPIAVAVDMPKELSSQAPAETDEYRETALQLGIPAELLTRRPDVRRAERQAAAQCARIGIATAELYPHIAITGAIGVEANYFGHLFEGSKSLVGSVGPSFQWNILNYGRLKNNIRVQDARFQQLVAHYQNTVLKANAEVENALVAFLKSHRRAKLLAAGAEAARAGVKVTWPRYNLGEADTPFVVVALLQEKMVQQYDEWAQAQGDETLALIQMYRALGGGWQIRLPGAQRAAAAERPSAPRPETIPTPPVEEPSAPEAAIEP
jgi:outer membrane protein TolC